MKKSLFSLMLLMPFVAKAVETAPKAQVVLQSILTLKKMGVRTSPILNDLSNKSKIELLDSIPLEIQNANNIDVVDLRTLEYELKSSIHDTI